MLIIAARPHVIPFAAELAGFLDKGRGRLRETVEAVTMDSDNEEAKGLGVLHLAAGNGKVKMCRHLVEGLLMDVDFVDSAGRSIPLSRQILAYQELWFYSRFQSWVQYRFHGYTFNFVVRISTVVWFRGANW